MTAWAEDALMAEGRAVFSCDYSPALLDELLDVSGRPKKLHGLLSRSDGAGGWTLTDTFVLQAITPDQYGMALEFSGLAWWLGTAGADGPLIRSRSFVSGLNKLPNGDFEYAQAGADIFGWKSGQGSLWFATVGTAHNGSSVAAIVYGDNLLDDILVSDNTFVAVPGEVYRNQLWVIGGSGGGRLRIRTVLESKVGFQHPNLLSNGVFESTTGWTEASTVAGDAAINLSSSEFAHSGLGHLRMTTTLYAPHANGGFETGTLTGWTDENPPAGGAAWGITTGEKFTGSYSAYGGFGDSSKHRLIMNNAGGAGTGVIPVVPGQTWRLQGAIKAGTGTDAPNATSARCRLVARVANASSQLVGTFIAGDIGSEVVDWTIYQIDFDIPAEIGATGFLVAHVEIEGRTAGRFYADGIEVVRLKGNRSGMGHTGWNIIPGRNYLLSAFIRSDGTAMQGQVWPGFRFDSGAGSIPIFVEGQRQSVSNEWTLYTMTVTPPSGSTVMSMAWAGQDIIGGAFHIDDCTFVDTDPSTQYRDVIGPTSAASWTLLSQDVTVPAGTDHIRTVIVAEAHSNGWLADDAFLGRIGITPSTTGSVIASLMTDPDTGTALSVAVGTVDSPSVVIPYDWVIRNQNVRDALDHFCRVIASPQLEWQIDPVTRRLNVGIPSVVFVDHTPAGPVPLVYLESDVTVESLPALRQSSADLVSKVLVIGAEKTSVTGAPLTPTGLALNATGIVDYLGNPLNRTRVLDDSTVDHPGYALALALDTAARNAQALQTITVNLSGEADRGAPPGDWVYAYKPESGLSDPAYATTINGTPVSPARKRVLVRTRHFAAGYKLELRRYDGSFLPVVVNWEDAAATTLELGDYRQSFQSDPQGPGAGRSYMRFRTSTPR